MATDGPVSRVNGIAYPASEERQLATATLTAGNPAQPFSVIPGRRVGGNGLAVTVGGSPEQVTVSPGAAVIYDSANAALGAYVIAIPTAITVALAARPTAGTTRTDLIVARVYDDQAGLGSTREVKILRVSGSTPPPMSLILATLVTPSSGNIAVTPNTARSVAAGGVLPVATDAIRDDLPKWSGFTIYNEQRARLEVCDGTGWAAVGGKSAVRLLRRTGNILVPAGQNIPLGSGWSAQTGDGGDTSGIVNSDGVMTFNAAGLYWVSLRFVVPSISSGTWSIGVMKNGSDPIANNDLNAYEQEGLGTTIRYQAHLSLVAGDTLQAFVRSSNDSPTIQAATRPNRFELRRVSD